MIRFSDFARLRLRHFVRDAGEIAPLEEWEFLGRRWVGEAIGFTQFLRRQDDPETLRALALDLEMLPDSVAGAVLDRVGLPLRFGLDEDELSRLLGPPAGSVRYGTRTTLEFAVAGDVPYELLCTLGPADGLVYLSLLARAPRRARPRPSPPSHGGER